MTFFFFFSSRRRHTRLQGDWSSDVCSSDLGPRLDARDLPRLPHLTLDLGLPQDHRVEPRGNAVEVAHGVAVALHVSVFLAAPPPPRRSDNSSHTASATVPPGCAR